MTGTERLGFDYANEFIDDVFGDVYGEKSSTAARQRLWNALASAYSGGRTQQPDDALRVAAREAATLAENIAAHIDDLGGSGGDTVRSIASILKAALDAAPWEPSEEMVERAVGVFLFRAPDAYGLNSRMRAALRAAFSPGGSPSGTGQQQTGR